MTVDEGTLILGAPGATNNITSVTFIGNRTQKYAALDISNGVSWAEVKAVPVVKSTVGISYPRQFDANGQHYFTKSQRGVNILYYGKQDGTVLMFK